MSWPAWLPWAVGAFLLIGAGEVAVLAVAAHRLLVAVRRLGADIDATTEAVNEQSRDLYDVLDELRAELIGLRVDLDSRADERPAR